MIGDPATLSASAAAKAVASRQISALELADALLARVAEREPDVRAWAFLDPDQVRAAARAADCRHDGVLRGVPFGIKDVIATADMPTQYNSPIYAGHRPATDAICVARLRGEGAIIMGKTVTTEFAFTRPGPTRNPFDPARTPGGSSSGSAAAVAACMVSAALGTQTGGSTIRPAAFCGVFGYKPAFERWDTAGVKPLAPSLDTLGLLCRDLDDIPLISGVLGGAVQCTADVPAQPLEIRVLLPPHAGQADAESLALLESLGPAQAAPAEWSRLDAAHRIIMSVEVARAFATEWRRDRDRLGPGIAAFIQSGLERDEAEIASAWRTVAQARRWLFEQAPPGRVIATLSTPGPAPLGLEATGNAVFCRLWTLLHAACLHVPAGLGRARLPIGVQLVQAAGQQADLIAAAKALRERFGLGLAIEHAWPQPQSYTRCRRP